jgi:integrase
MAGRPRLNIGTYGNIPDPWQMPSGQWQTKTSFRDSDGVTRPVTATGATPAKAKAALRAKLKDRRSRMGGDELSGESTLAELLDQWMETVRARIRPDNATEHGDKKWISKDTAEGYQDIVDRILKPDLGQVLIREWTPQRAHRYLSGRETRQREIRVVLNQTCSLGVRFGAMEFNPIRETVAPPRKVADKRTLTESEVSLLISRIKAWQGEWQGGPRRAYALVEIFVLLMATGERIAEVLALRWEDIEFLDDEKQPVRVTTAGTVGKDGKRKSLPKTDHGYRTVLLPEFGRRALQTQCDCEIPYDLVFPTRKGTPFFPSNIRTHWHEIRGEDYKWVVPKSFRKTAATTIEREFGAEAAAAQLGHGSPDVTRKHYIRRAKVAGDYTSALDRFDPFSVNKRSKRPNLHVVGDEETPD